MQLNKPGFTHQWVLQVTDKFALRIKEVFIAIASVAGIISTHMDLIHLNPNVKDTIELGCIVILVLNHSVKEPQ